MSSQMIQKITTAIFSTFILLLSCNLVFAQAAILLNAYTQFFDNNGNPLSSGTVTTYIPNTSTLKTTWQDGTELIPNSNPITLDAAGRAIIYGQGTYRQVVKDVNGNLIWDGVATPGAANNGPANIGDGNLVGVIIPWSGLTAPNQYAFSYGQTFNRVTFATLFAAETLSAAVTCTSGSPVISGFNDTTGIPIGAPIEASACVIAGTTVLSKTATSVTVSNNSSASINTTAVVFPYGNGDGSTTFNVPDLRGVALFGNNNMGGIASSKLNSTYALVNPNATGAAVGGQSQTLLLAQTPSFTYTPTGTIATTFNNAGLNGGNQGTFNIGGLAGTPVGGVVYSGLGSNISIASQTFTGALATLGGSNAAHTIVPPGLTINYIIKTTPDISGSGVTGVASIGGMQGVIACGSGIVCTGNTISFGGLGGGAAQLNVIQTWTAAQSFTSSDFLLLGASSGSLTINCASACGSNTLTFPAGTTNFSATGGANQFLKQTSSGGALTVATITAGDIAGSAANHAIPVDVAGTPTWKVIPDCTDISGNHLNYTQSTDAISCGNTSSGGGGSSTVIPPQGRLTLQSGIPVMRVSQTNKTTIYYDCYHGGNIVPYWNGMTDNLDTVAACEVSDALANSGTGVINNGDVFDVWWVHGGANRICVATNGTGGGWASDAGGGSITSRGTGYSALDTTTRPYITNTNALTHCYNGATDYGSVGANQASYLGTFFSTAAGQTSYTLGSSASGGGAANLYLWNMYNRITVATTVIDSNASWSYSSAPVRNTDASTSNRISWVSGFAEDGYSFAYFQQAASVSPNAILSIGFSLDNSGATSPDSLADITVADNGLGLPYTLHLTRNYGSQIGVHFVQAQEATDGTVTAVFAGGQREALSGNLRM